MISLQNYERQTSASKKVGIQVKVLYPGKCRHCIQVNVGTVSR
jgi:hypothetical protein